MHKYCFILGSNPTLSVWEIASVMNSRKIDYQLVGLFNGFLFLDVEKPLRASFLDRLGGTVKIIEIIKEIDSKKLEEAVTTQDLVRGSKIVYGFSIYDMEGVLSRNQLSAYSQVLTRLGLDLKKELRREGHSVRFITSREHTLSSIIVEDNKLIESSGEWSFFFGRGQTLLGRTIAVQQAAWYSWRDYGRPARDARSGMLPPKLAKMLINISGIDPASGGALLDPFCGSGTVLQEAGILGFKHLIALDRNPEALRRSQENWKWLVEKGQIIDKDIASSFILGDAQSLSDLIPLKSVEAVVTEGYLGEPMNKPNLNAVHHLVEELSDVYFASFEQFKKILRPGGRVSITFPVFILEGKRFFLPITKQIADLGFRPSLTLPAKAKDFDVMQVSDRGSVLYGRPDQKVWREVFVWKMG